ncbi:hypothetical protein [Marinagarivorans cellulosilyticus]|uniref:Uncharacterized protein n=1 Tax=Marinagarivorans cellulosilyticus TaxID=2721545 RepID=A0AAN1WEM8_9GAMM|nr:hypothetical protein [Marinagarivorans cellulosilyticus]BCD96191.1 hypothetical protein MARGE09_P0390 [Marinagarivorans cellulosilyticus]
MTTQHNAQQRTAQGLPYSLPRKPLATAVLLGATLVLGACGGSGEQDRGHASTLNNSFSGVAIDGHIARSKVFIDTNNNATRDPWEPYAFTDDEGYYGYNPNTDTNYCAADAEPEQQQYCLNTVSSFSDVVIRIDGGYDILTGEPFIGQLSRRIDARIDSDTKNTVISPITTLLTSIEDNTDTSNVLNALGIEPSDLDVDYLNSAGNGEVHSYLLNTAIKLHKTVTVLSDRIDDNYEAMHDNTGMPNDASQSIYESLAASLARPEQNLDTTLTDNTQLISILDNAEDRIRAIYTQRDIALPSDMGSTDAPNKHARAATLAAQIPPVVNRLLNVLDVSMDQGQVLGNARALEAVVIKAVNERAENDTDINNAFSFFLDPGNDSKLETLRVALSDDQADINALANNDFTGSDFETAQDITNAARVRDDASAFTNLGGKQLKISDLDLGFAPNNLNDIELELYFTAGGSGLSGSIIACAKYIDGASQTRLGEGNFRGEVLNGFWSLLGATAENPSSYSLLLTFDFLGANYQAIMKPAGETAISGVNYQQIRFDYDGEIRVWHSEAGFAEQTQSIPTNAKDCEQRLPSRVGL